jgi:hypothetical protein
MRSTLQHIAILTLMAISCYQIYTNIPTYIHLCSNIETGHLLGVDINNKIIVRKVSNDFSSVIDNICFIANTKNVYFGCFEFTLNKTNYNKAPKLNDVILINIIAIGIESLLLGLL